MKVRQLKKVFDIINAEGPILALHKGTGNKLYLSSYLNDGTGTVYYTTTKALLGQFARSQITIDLLYLNSDDFLVKHDRQGVEYTCLKEEFSGKLQCGGEKFNSLNNDMKNLKFKKGYAKY